MNLTCAVCGGNAPGRQWWNRDTGYGVCPTCFKEEVQRDGLYEAVLRYGHPGEHHSLDAAEPATVDNGHGQPVPVKVIKPTAAEVADMMQKAQI